MVLCLIVLAMPFAIAVYAALGKWQLGSAQAYRPGAVARDGVPEVDDDIFQ